MLSHTAEYALRAMAWLALQEEGSAMRALDLCELTDIPAHYLSKILRRLVLEELLLSQKGHGGGFMLARPPEQIRIFDVLAAVDAAPVRGVCAFGWDGCGEGNHCPLHDIWSRFSTAFCDWANNNTLADVRPMDLEALRRRKAPGTS